DERARLRMGDLQLPGEGVRTLPVDGGEVDRFRARTHLRRDAVHRHVKDQCRCLSVDIAASLKCLNERGIAGQVREDPELDLRVVGADEEPAASRNEAASNVAAELAPYRNVLQVWI